MLKILPIFFIATVLTVSVGAEELKGNAYFSRVYESTGGAVTFPHGMHADQFSKKCNFCHSALRTFGGVSQIYGHKICGVCHEKRGGPAACDSCHDTTSVEISHNKTR